ncbi:MAG: hypothetical protein JWM91_4772 [Rhodospirillales bacterium]|nr:hypothetical protein [Rhodospirillales bacterium]
MGIFALGYGEADGQTHRKGGYDRQGGAQGTFGRLEVSWFDTMLAVRQLWSADALATSVNRSTIRFVSRRLSVSEAWIIAVLERQFSIFRSDHFVKVNPLLIDRASING